MAIVIPFPSRFSWKRFFNASFMVFGTTVGAGMLGIPLMTADQGFGVAFLLTLLTWIFMGITGLLLLEVTFHRPKGSNFITLSSDLLGKKGKWVAITFFLFLYYAFLVAYFSGGAPLLGEFFSFLNIPHTPFSDLFLFFCLFGGVVFFGVEGIHRVNFLMSIVMLVVFCFLILWGSTQVTKEKLSLAPSLFSFAPIPVLFGAFGFHNVIPSLSYHLHGEKRVLRGAIVFGTFLAFTVYVIWQWLVLGALSPAVLKEVLLEEKPVTYALSQGANHGVYVLGQIFGFFALTTSFLGVSLSLVDFIKDGIEQNKRFFPRVFYVALALLPPLFCVCLNPHLFDRALGLAGGFGEALLNGALPVLLFSRMQKMQAKRLSSTKKMFIWVLFLFSIFVMVVEVISLF